MIRKIITLTFIAITIAFPAPAEVMRITDTVDELPCISSERRLELARNPEGKTPDELNRLLPEINAVELYNAASDATPGDRLRLIAWNLERGRARQGAVQLIEAHPALQNPDIIFLSEMDRGMERAGNEHTTRLLAEALGMNYAYAVEYLELPRGKTEADWEAYAQANHCAYEGNAILSRFPLHNARALRFPGIELWYGSSQHRLGGRVAVVAEIEAAQGQRITLVSTHLESGFSDGPMRAQQTQMILDEVEAHAQGQPVLIGGDMNALPQQPAIQLYRDAGFEVDSANLLREGTLQFIRDGEIFRGGFHIDYLIVRGVEVVQNEHSPAVVLAAWPNNPQGEFLSDHAVISLDVLLKP
jgi:endonuclease/exonuclease/phosphatase family metal-dependent hydrolase